MQQPSDEAASGYSLLEPRAGDLEWIVQRQPELYAREYGKTRNSERSSPSSPRSSSASSTQRRAAVLLRPGSRLAIPGPRAVASGKRLSQTLSRQICRHAAHRALPNLSGERQAMADR